MWHVEHTLETTTPPEAIWKRWTDLESWPDWDEALEWARLVGPVAVGSWGTLKRRGGDRFKVQVVEAEEGRRWVLLAKTLGADLRLVHKVEPAPLGARLTHRVEVQGFTAWLLHLTLARRLRESLPKAARKLAGLAGRA